MEREDQGHRPRKKPPEPAPTTDDPGGGLIPIDWSDEPPRPKPAAKPKPITPKPAPQVRPAPREVIVDVPEFPPPSIAAPPRPRRQPAPGPFAVVGFLAGVLTASLIAWLIWPPLARVSDLAGTWTMTLSEDDKHVKAGEFLIRSDGTARTPAREDLRITVEGTRSSCVIRMNDTYGIPFVIFVGAQQSRDEWIGWLMLAEGGAAVRASLKRVE